MNRWAARAWSPARGRALYGARSQRAGLKRWRPQPRPPAAALKLGGREGGVRGEGAGQRGVVEQRVGEPRRRLVQRRPLTTESRFRAGRSALYISRRENTGTQRNDSFVEGVCPGRGGPAARRRAPRALPPRPRRAAPPPAAARRATPAGPVPFTSASLWTTIDGHPTYRSRAGALFH